MTFRGLLALPLIVALVPFAPALGQQVPDGSYLQSCSTIVLNGSRLTATCNRAAGGTNRSSISLNSCSNGNIANVDGSLRCNGPNRGNGYLPPGSYLQSCRNISKRHHIVSATCNAPNGSPVNSSLDLRRCPPGAGIANRNGYLSCGGTPGGGWNGSLPEGSYQQSCQNITMSGPVLAASCTSPNGGLVRSSLDTRRCQWNSGIRNSNGRLQCARYR